MFYRLKSFCCIKYYIQLKARRCQFKSNQKQEKMFNRLKRFCCIKYYIQLQPRRCWFKSNQKQEKIFNRLKSSSYKLEDVSSILTRSKGGKCCKIHSEKMYVIHCTFTFLVYHPQKHLYRKTSCTERQVVQKGKLYRKTSCTERQVVQKDKLYRKTSCTESKNCIKTG